MKNTNNKYFAVVAKCGHVGRKQYVPIKFAVAAESGKEAARIVRKFGRVKHDHKDAILSVEEITKQEYIIIKENNKSDPYLQCKSRHEQNDICDLSDRVVFDSHSIKQEHNKQDRQARVSYKLKRARAALEYDWEEDYGYAY